MYPLPPLSHPHASTRNRDRLPHPSPSPPAGIDGPIATTAVQSPHHERGQFRAEQLQQSTATRLEIVTEDGDTISLSMSTHWNSATLQASRWNPQQQHHLALSHHSEGYAIHYRVEGELDDRERKALDEVIAKVTTAADHFYSGHLAEAITSLEQFDMNSEEFTSVALSMQQTIRYSAAEAYREVGRLGHRPSTLPSANLGGLAHFTLELEDLLEEVKSLFQRFSESQQFLLTLLQQALERDPRVADLEPHTLTQGLQFMQQVVTQLQARSADPATTKGEQRVEEKGVKEHGEGITPLADQAAATTDAPKVP